MKQFVLTEQDFKQLLNILELQKHRASENLIHLAEEEIEARHKQGSWSQGVREHIADKMMEEAHRALHYHVYQWVREMQK